MLSLSCKIAQLTNTTIKMKKLLLLSVTAVATLFACGGSETATKTTTAPAMDTAQAATEKICKKGYDKGATKIGFGGFKYTEKAEVKGYFKDFTIEGTTIADSPEEIFANATFIVPVNYIETNDVGRNRRIRDEYFGNMTNSTNLTGKVLKFNTDSSTIDVELTINEVTKPVTLNYALSGDTINLMGNIDILDFEASAALEAINKACEALHKGSDGVSKTWSDVNLYISSVVTEACE